MTSVVATVDPGCYGHASIFNAKSDICKACGCFKECSKKVGEKLKAFAAKADVGDYLRRHENESGGEEEGKGHIQITVMPERKTKTVHSKRRFTEREQAMLDEQPVKPRNELRKVFEAGLHKGALEALQAGHNPFPYDGKRYLHVACAMLLEGGFTKASLRERYMTQLGWTQGTAFSHVSIVCAIFKTLGFAQETNGGFSVTPASKN